MYRFWGNIRLDEDHQIIEHPGAKGGVDLIDSIGPVHVFTLPDKVENVRLTVGELNRMDGFYADYSEVTGNAADNVMQGTELTGDRFEGLAGNDTFDGRGGDDHLWGGEGADTFVFRGATTVHDFSQAEGDLIGLDGDFSVRTESSNTVISSGAEDMVLIVIHDLTAGNFSDSWGLIA